jgi:hypothetical protein
MNLIVESKINKKIEFVNGKPIYVDVISNSTYHGVEIKHQDTDITFLDIVSQTVDEGCFKIVTTVSKWWFNGWIWDVKTLEQQQVENSQYPKYVESQQYNIWTTRDKLVKLVGGIPQFIDEKSQEFTDSWGEDGEPIVGYYRAYDFFKMHPQNVPMLTMQLAQIAAKYPDIGQSYTV